MEYSGILFGVSPSHQTHEVESHEFVDGIGVYGEDRGCSGLNAYHDDGKLIVHNQEFGTTVDDCSPSRYASWDDEAHDAYFWFSNESEAIIFAKAFALGKERGHQEEKKRIEGVIANLFKRP